MIMERRRWWREPFVHFIALGIVLFAAAPYWSGAAGDDAVITVDTPTRERLHALWEIEALRPPGPEDKATILADHVREEALVREAERLGLATGDTVVRRRLAQKMTELIHDTVELDDPDEATLKTWFAANPDRFTAPQRRTFAHIFFTGNAAANGQRIAAAMQQLDAGAAWQQLGDAFIEKRSYSDLNQGEVSRIFGRNFAASLFQAKPRLWQGPVASALGTHLIRVVSVTASEPARFDSQRPAILAAYREEQRRKANEEAIDAVLSRYAVNITE